MKSKLIVALDVDSYERAVALVKDLRDAVEMFKVGSILFTLFTIFSALEDVASRRSAKKGKK